MPLKEQIFQHEQWIKRRPSAAFWITLIVAQNGFEIFPKDLPVDDRFEFFDPFDRLDYGLLMIDHVKQVVVFWDRDPS